MNKTLSVAIIACFFMAIQAYEAPPCEICFAEQNIEDPNYRICLEFDRWGTPTFDQGQVPLMNSQLKFIRYFKYAILTRCPCIFRAYNTEQFEGKTKVWDNYDGEETDPHWMTFPFCGKSFKLECAADPGYFEEEPME